VLIGAGKGLFRRAEDKLVPMGGPKATGDIVSYVALKNGGAYMTSTPLIDTEGVSRRGGKLVTIGGAEATGDNLGFYETRDGTLLIGGEKGLFGLVQRPWAEASVTLADSADVSCC
jgi:hypothetical protein